MTDACVASIADECRSAWQAMGSPAWFQIYCDWANEVWNSDYTAFDLTVTMSHPLGLAGPNQAYAYMANRATSEFKSVFDAAGQPGLDHRVLSCQFGNPGSYLATLGLATSQGSTV